MPPISSSLRAIIWIGVGVASLVLAILAIALEENLRYLARRLIPQERRKGGRPPTPKHVALWVLFWLSGLTVIAGTAIASSAPDAEDARQQDVAQAKSLIVNEVLTDLSNIDARLGFVEAALAPDATGEALEAVRETAVPDLAAVLEQGYRQLIGAQQVASLRQALNSRPLYSDLGPSLIPVLLDSGVDPGAVRFFYDQLVQVQDASESLLATLSDVASREVRDEQMATYDDRLIALTVEVLHNRSAVTQLAGLAVLNRLGVEPSPEVAGQLEALNHLEIRHMVDEVEATDLLAARVTETEELVAQRQALLEEIQNWLGKLVKEQATIEAMLTINATDTWEEVVGKAISLRQFGRTTDAVAAFARYGEMFAATDPTAERYSRTAQQFSLQLQALGVEGGVYVFEIVNESAAEQGGLAAGDIVIDYNGRPTASVPDLLAAIQSAPTGERVKLTYLRMDEDGRFSRQATTVTAGPLGAGIMPI